MSKEPDEFVFSSPHGFGELASSLAVLRCYHDFARKHGRLPTAGEVLEEVVSVKTRSAVGAAVRCLCKKGYIERIAKGSFRFLKNADGTQFTGFEDAPREGLAKRKPRTLAVSLNGTSQEAAPDAS